MAQRRTELDNKVREGLVKVAYNGTGKELVEFYNENAEDYEEVGVTTLTNQMSIN